MVQKMASQAERAEQEELTARCLADCLKSRSGKESLAEVLFSEGHHSSRR